MKGKKLNRPVPKKRPKIKADKILGAGKAPKRPRPGSGFQPVFEKNPKPSPGRGSKPVFDKNGKRLPKKAGAAAPGKAGKRIPSKVKAERAKAAKLKKLAPNPRRGQLQPGGSAGFTRPEGSPPLSPPPVGPADRPGANRPGGNRPGGNRPGGNRPGGNRPGGNRPGGNGRRRRKKGKKLDFIDKEIGAMIRADDRLTDYTSAATQKIIEDMIAADKQYASLIGGFQANNAMIDPTLDPHTIRDMKLNAEMGNQVSRTESDALAALSAKIGAADMGLMQNSRASLARQHREYAQRMRGLAPYLRMQREGELADAEVKRAQIQLAAQARGLDERKFGLDVAELDSLNQNRTARLRLDAQKASSAQKNKSAAARRTAVAALRKELFKTGPNGEWMPPRQQFRTSLRRLLELGLSPARAAATAASWAKHSDTQAGTPITFREGHGMGVYNSMRSLGVSKKDAMRITRMYYPDFKIHTIGDAVDAVNGIF